jgi:hypothetical protein
MQHSSGGHARLGQISCHGNAYFRTLLIQGARSSLQRAKAVATEKTTPEQWRIRALDAGMPDRSGRCRCTTWTSTHTLASTIRCIGKFIRRTQLTRPSNNISFQRQREVVDNGSSRPRGNLTNQMDVHTVYWRSPGTGQSDERMSSPGAVYTQVRVSTIDATRPFTEIQPGNVQLRKH